MIPRTFTDLSVVVLLGFISVPAAEASTLSGATLSWQYYAGGMAYNPDSGGSSTSGAFVDDGGVSGTFSEPGPLDFFNIVATPATIAFDYSPYYDVDGSWSSSPLSLSPTIFNGIAIDLTAGGTFANVTIDPLTNMTGFVSTDLSFTGSEIQVNWAGLSFTTSTVVTLDVTLAGADCTPEPATWSLMALSLVIGGFVYRREPGRYRIYPRR